MNTAGRTRLMSRALPGQCFNDAGQRLLSQCTDFVIGTVLNRVRYEHHRRIHAQRLALQRSSFDEFARSNAYTGNATAFKVAYIMHTARRTGTSVSQPFNEDVAFIGDALLQLGRRDTRKRWLTVAFDRNALFGK